MGAFLPIGRETVGQGNALPTAALRYAIPTRSADRVGALPIKMLGVNELPLREVGGFAANFTARTGAESPIGGETRKTNQKRGFDCGWEG